jgi:ferredoxin-NADP reductase/CRP-like cAMP-binding protein
MSIEPDIVESAFHLLAAARPFNSLPRNALLKLAAYATERSVIPGEMIIHEGEVGTEFYLVAAGAFHVLGRAFDGTELVLARLEAGSCFGEQALLAETASPRSASVRAVTRGRLLVFSDLALKEAGETDAFLLASLRKTSETHRAERANLYRDRVLTDLGIRESYTIEHFEPDQYVFHEGEPGDKIYLILVGRALVTRRRGGTDQILSELLPGQFFGELAILNDAPRAASVRAEGILEVAALDGVWFRATLEQNPRLRTIMTSLQSMYLLPGRGVVTLQSSGLASHPTLTAVHHLPDGKRVLSVRFIEGEAFRAQIIGAAEATSSVRFSNPAARTYRQIHLFEQRIVEIECEGIWPDLGIAFERMLNGGIVDQDEIAAFEATGDLGKATPPTRDAAEIVCRCSGATAADIVAAIGKGCDSLEGIARETRAAVVCGGCIPTVKEFLGQDEWSAAACEMSIPLTSDIRMFRIQAPSSIRPFLPGQHVIVQARIRGRWVERPYTIASAPSTESGYELVVRREEHGLLSRWLFEQLGEGGALRISLPRGTFCITPSQARDTVFFAGGIGITPALAMARSIKMLPGSWTLAIDHSVSTEDQGVYRDELESLSRAYPRIIYRLRVTTREGRIGPADIAAYAQRYQDATFLICGSNEYVEGLTALLEIQGVSGGQIDVERFIPWG